MKVHPIFYIALLEIVLDYILVLQHLEVEPDIDKYIFKRIIDYKKLDNRTI